MAYLEMHRVCKAFGRTIANDGAELTVEKGQVHALLGENGAGKSTLMNILYGMYPPDSGEILLRGERVCFSSPSEAIAMGVGMVHQHFMLIPQQTVIENVVLGGASNPFVLNLREQAAEFTRLAAQYHMEIDPWIRVKELSVGQQQRLEILKALYRHAELLILDEPTAVLTPQEVQQLFHMIHNLSEQGCTVLLITHKLAEITAVCTHCTVLRQGKTVAAMEIRPDLDRHTLAAQMVGREVQLSLDKEPVRPGEAVLQVENLTFRRRDGTKAVDGVSFSVREGEIVGICGVDGNGQSELIRCIAGLDVPAEGSAAIRGVPSGKKGAKPLLRNGVAHIPEDRLKMAVVQDMSVAENIALMHYDQEPLCHHGLLNQKELQAWSEKVCEEYQVRLAGMNQPIRELSGGNQQKVVVGRELLWNPRLLLVVHPSRGLDIGATKYIQSRLLQARSEGAAVLLVSTELDEIMELSDRILVIYNGHIEAELSQKEATREYLGMLMGGIHQ